MTGAVLAIFAFVWLASRSECVSANHSEAPLSVTLRTTGNSGDCLCSDTSLGRVFFARPPCTRALSAARRRRTSVMGPRLACLPTVWVAPKDSMQPESLAQPTLPVLVERA